MEVVEPSLTDFLIKSLGHVGGVSHLYSGDGERVVGQFHNAIFNYAGNFFEHITALIQLSCALPLTIIGWHALDKGKYSTWIDRGRGAATHAYNSSSNKVYLDKENVFAGCICSPSPVYTPEAYVYVSGSSSYYFPYCDYTDEITDTYDDVLAHFLRIAM